MGHITETFGPVMTQHTIPDDIEWGNTLQNSTDLDQNIICTKSKGMYTRTKIPRAGELYTKSGYTRGI
jgi:hypothetical protein